MYVKIFGVLSFRNFNLSEPWAVDTLTVSNFRLSINRPFGFLRCLRIQGMSNITCYQDITHVMLLKENSKFEFISK